MYDLTDWFLDAMDRGQCMSCKGFTLERMGTLEAQCYSCGKWYVGYDLGQSQCELRHLSTSHQHEKRQRTYGQTHENMRFEEELSYSPEPHDDYGDYPE